MTANGPSMEDFLALQEEVRTLRTHGTGLASARGLGQYTGQEYKRFRQMIERIDAVSLSNSSGKTTLMSFTLPPRTFMGAGRQCHVYIAGDIGNGTVTNRTCTPGVTVAGVEVIADATPLNAGDSGAFEWDTRITGYPSSATTLRCHSRYMTSNNIFDTTTNHGLIYAAATVDMDQPITISFTMTMSVADANVAAGIYTGIAELL